MKITNNNTILYTGTKFNNIQSKYKTANNLQTDVFQRRVSSSNSLSFKGIQGLFRKTPNLVPQIEVLPKVSNDFVSSVTKQISEFSPEWLKKFKAEGYKIILAPTFSEAYKSQGVFDPMVEYFERTNPKGTLGVTYSEGKFGKNFFAFCDKPPYSNRYMPSIVNHELSHGIVNISGVDKDQKTLEMIKKDVELIIKSRKLDKLSPNERMMISHYFFNKNAYLPVDELAADVCAWNKGGGVYGSGLVLDVNKPNLMPELFPNLSRYLKTIKP